MKGLYFLISLLTTISCYAQEFQIQVRLVEAGIGHPTGDPIDDGYIAISNDDGLNDIFNTYNATNYYPGENGVPAWNDRTHFVLCDGCDIDAFQDELDAYSSVIENTIQNTPGEIANALFVRLLDVDNGSPTGNTDANGVIITNNDVLNEIFVTYKVLHYTNAFPNSNSDNLMRTMNLGCDCDGSELKIALDAQTEIIEFTEFQVYAILNLDESVKLDITIFPNPVGDKLNIQTTEKIQSLEILNQLGQIIIEAPTLDLLNNDLKSLETGNYLLQVKTPDNKKGVFKIIKR